VLDWLRHGVSRREIARRRRTSLDAVKYHIANITAKIGVDGSGRLRTWPGYPASSTLSGRTPMQTTGISLGPLGQVSLYVRDIGRAEAFYRDTLGLPHIFTFGDLGFFDLGGVRLYVHAKPDDEWRPGSVLYFLVEDIASAYDVLGARGVKLTGAPHVIYTDDETGVEEWMAFFEDSEGNLLALMSRVQSRDPAREP
jgi:catechol 2,3-dioxygenase-like lactoylglutathione lyase family enzyme